MGSTGRLEHRRRRRLQRRRDQRHPAARRAGNTTDWLGQPGGAGFTDNIASFNINTGTMWHVAGTGDFNGSGADDIIWQSDDGVVRDWLGQLNATFVGNIDKVNITTGTDWHVLGTGDFNGDGRSDVLWQNDNGTVRDWLGQADGSFVGNIDHVNILTGTDWHVRGTGDFNGDGREDILWQHDNGTVREWLGQADGSFAGNTDILNFIPAATSHIVGIGDFDGNGRDDLLWRDDAGTITTWLGQVEGWFLDNSAVASQPLSTELQIAGVGDFNGDGKSDVLLRGTDGMLEAWVGAANGAILSPMEKMWQEAIDEVAEFVGGVESNLIPSADPALGQPVDYAAIFGPYFPHANNAVIFGTPLEEFDSSVSSFFIFDFNFSLSSIDPTGFSASFGDDNFGSITQVDSLTGTYLFNMNGMNLVGDWHEGAPPVDPGDIVITGHRNSDSSYTTTGYFLFSAANNGLDFHDGYGGSSHTISPTSPLNSALRHSAVITVGHHNVYLPSLDSLSADQKAAALAFINAVETIDAKIGQLPSDATITVTESWTDAAGVSHPVTVTETGADLAAHWGNTSFALFTTATYGTLDTNGTGRGGANLGADPRLTGNIIAGFDLGTPGTSSTQSTGLLGYFQGNGLAAMQYLALHEVAHDTAAGMAMYRDTPNKLFNDFTPGTTNYADENFANTVALATMELMALSLNKYDPNSGSQIVRGGWQTDNIWTLNHE